MINIEDEFNTLIKKEKLNDFSIYFSDYESYEEIPLFSRYKNISFLSELSINEKNKMLIRKGIELIRNIRGVSLSYLTKDEMEDYFICLSITDWDFYDYKEINCLLPHIYVSRKKRVALILFRTNTKKLH